MSLFGNLTSDSNVGVIDPQGRISNGGINPGAVNGGFNPGTINGGQLQTGNRGSGQPLNMPQTAVARQPPMSDPGPGGATDSGTGGFNLGTLSGGELPGQGSVQNLGNPALGDKPVQTVSNTLAGGLNDAQFRAWINTQYGQAGQQLDEPGFQYWLGKYHEFGEADPAYFTTRLQQGLNGTTPPDAGTSAGSNGNGVSLDTSKLGGLIAPFTDTFHAPTQAEIEAMPGYQFNRDQGLLGLNRSLASSGVMNTGGAAKKGAEFTTGLANQYYQQDYQNALNEYLTKFNVFNSNQGNAFNRLFDVTQLGANSALGLGNLGANNANAIGQLQLQGGNAASAGTVGSANAWGNVIGNLAQLSQQQSRTSFG